MQLIYNKFELYSYQDVIVQLKMPIQLAHKIYKASNTRNRGYTGTRQAAAQSRTRDPDHGSIKVLIHAVTDQRRVTLSPTKHHIPDILR
jgi:hypothetical protein